MTEWFARPVLHVSNVEASLRFYVDRLGFTVPWRVEDEDSRAHIAEVDRRAAPSEAEVAAVDALRAELEARGV
jgi:catechol 2,3-dioxygenase-like lactoylglutathione lyase family enzyme